MATKKEQIEFVRKIYPAAARLYRAEADQYLMAYEGYIAEGKIAEADEQKALYLAKKAEIRERYPDNAK